jgi:putative peptide zinc metalloprotease protein
VDHLTANIQASKPLAASSMPVWDAVARAVSPNAAASAPSAWDMLGHSLSLSEERPQVVTGVESAHQTTRAGVPYVVIRNPAANTYLKLDPREFDLMRLMDGTRTIHELVIVYYQQNGVPAVSRIIDLVRLLQKTSFLTAPAQDAYTMLDKTLHGQDATTLLQRLVRGFMLTEFPLRDIDARLDAWYHAWGWVFFTRTAVFLGLGLTIIGSLFYALEFARQRYSLFHMGDSYLASFAVMFGTSMLALLIHEMGHALAVKHAGRHIPRGGFLLYYGMLVGYVDTTDVWMAPRRMRMMTAFAGMWTGLVLGGLCGVAVYFLPEGPLGAFLFVWGFVFLVSNLFNFNPFLELDGYYLLIDLIEKPKLRARALAFVRGPLWEKIVRRERLTREEYFFALFGFASLAHSLFAVYLAVFVWERRVWKLIEEALTSNNLLVQAGVLLLGAMVTIPLAMGLWGLAQQWLASATQKISRLSQRANVQRHRQASETLRAVPLWAKAPEA